ncbi:MAG: sulfur carrier protein ThiS [Pseudomonadales bacterium]
MDIILNGETTAIPDHLTVTQLIEQLGLAGKRIAIEINQTIVPRSAHADTVLHSGDRVEIVHAIGGG